MRHLLASLALSAAAVASAAESPVTTGWSEVTLIVADGERWASRLQRIGGLEVVAEGVVDPAIVAAYGGPASRGYERVLGLPGTSEGRVRLIDWRGEDLKQPPAMREGARGYDAGGWFEITFMVRDMAARVRELEAEGFRGYSAPLEGGMGPLRFTKVRMHGPDGIVVAMIERISPPLADWPAFDRFSHAFSASAIARDFPTARAFYGDRLGFAPYLEAAGNPKPGEPTLNGLPAATAHLATGRSSLLRPPPAAAIYGRVELLAYEGLDQRDYIASSAPPNRGIATLRYPVADVSTALAATGAPIAYYPVAASIAGLGRVTIGAVIAPHGGWIEFYATAAAPR